MYFVCLFMSVHEGGRPSLLTAWRRCRILDQYPTQLRVGYMDERKMKMKKEHYIYIYIYIVHIYYYIIMLKRLHPYTYLSTPRHKQDVA